MKLEIAHGPADLAANTWQGYNILPGNFGAGFATGYYIDFSQLAISSNYLYISANIYRTPDNTFTASGMLRIPLAEIDSHSALTADTLVSTTDFTYTPVSGATDTMYFAAQQPETSPGVLTSVGVFSWPESSTTASEYVVAGLGATYDAAFDCNSSILPNNPCLGADTRIRTGWVNATEVGFAWGSAQNGQAGRPVPFTRVLILNPQNLTSVISQPDIWSPYYAYLYLTVATNARGHLGGTIDALGCCLSVADTFVGVIHDDVSVEFWTLQPIATGTYPTDGWGAYNGASMHPVYQDTWLIGGHVELSGPVSVVHNSWIMRSRDVPTAPAVTFNPAAQVVAVGSIASFTSTASGTPTPTVQWQVSVDAGVTWTNVAGATSGTYSFAAAASDSGKTFRAVFTNPVGSATSTGALLTVLTTASIDKTSLSFTATTTGNGFAAQTGAQLVRLVQQGPGPMTWTVTSSSPWLVVSPAKGSGSGVLSVSVQFVPGVASTTGSITITLTGAANALSPIAVTLRVVPVGSTGAPFGSFDTPQDGATGVAGSIAVTGWALSNLQVIRLTICRDAAAGEAAPINANCANNAQIYIGDAIFIDGARTDVQGLYATLPFSSRAGWGYLLLTNFLPGLGNGTFILHAYAFDPVGRVTLLGNKTITCNNASSTAPFGAIDTPAQGEVVSGAAYANFGWVLSPGLNRADPPGGGIVHVFVDGIDLGPPNPGLWATRPDLQALFPVSQFSGVNTAEGVHSLDTTTLTNGLHTMFWVATGTNNSGSSGIGSEFFSVSNGGQLLNSAASSSAVVIESPPALDIPGAAAGRLAWAGALEAEIAAAPVDSSAVQGRRGFDLTRALSTYEPASGRIDVDAEELDRIELHLGNSEKQHQSLQQDQSLQQHQPQHLSGYLRTPAGLKPLPVGSSLDASTGTFTWAPGVGFYGSYDLTFVRWSGGTATARQDVRITLNAKGSNRLGPQTIVDVPVAGTAVGSPFFVGGWGADLDSAVDTGVSTVHVWAYPVDANGNRQDPIFIGPAIYGGARPDVSAVYGDRFADSGYGIIISGLAPGTYDVAVFAFSTVVNNFTPAKVVRITVR
jgi:hypothetical protein